MKSTKNMNISMIKMEEKKGGKEYSLELKQTKKKNEKDVTKQNRMKRI